MREKQRILERSKVEEPRNGPLPKSLERVVSRGFWVKAKFMYTTSKSGRVLRRLLPSFLQGGHCGVSMTLSAKHHLPFSCYSLSLWPRSNTIRTLAPACCYFALLARITGSSGAEALQTTCNSSPFYPTNFRISCNINTIGSPVWKLTRSTGIHNCGICPVEQVNILRAWARRYLLVVGSRYHGAWGRDS